MSASSPVKKVELPHPPDAVSGHEAPQLHAVPDAHETKAASAIDQTQESTHDAVTEAAKVDAHPTHDTHHKGVQEKPHTDTPATTPAESHVTSHTSQVLQPPEGFFGKAAFYGKKFWKFLQDLLRS